MGQFGQFGLHGFKQGQTHFSQLHISLDPDELESCDFVCNLITGFTGFLKLHVWAVITRSVPYRPQTLMHIICRFVQSLFNLHKFFRCILENLQ